MATPLTGLGDRALAARALSTLSVGLLIGLFGFGFAWLAVQRHETYNTNAEDLGFTDQVIWNWLRGQAFRFSIYEQADYSTDVDLASLTRPDSFLAFHVEPMTALLASLYLIWPDVRLMLIVQAVGWSLGAIPAYRLARRRLQSRALGLTFAAIYLLAPLGQWAALADLHTVLLAAPLLLWAVDLLDLKRPLLFLIVGLLAASAKEEVGLAVASLGFLALWSSKMRPAGLAALVLGLSWSLICVTLIIPRYAGTAVSPFTTRYEHLGASPGAALANLVQAPQLYMEVLSRPVVHEYAATLILSGGWLALLAPELLLPLAPSLALNVLSNSPWMASGRAHYSSVILPFLIVAAIVGCQRLATVLRRIQIPTRIAALLPALLVLLTTAVAYVRAGAGPLSDGFAVPRRTEHHVQADSLLAQIPKSAKVSASSSLVPHLSQRPEIYLFPTVREAEYVALDVSATPFPTSAGDVFLRASALLGTGDWTLVEANDGLLLFWRGPAPTQPLPERFFGFARADQNPTAERPLASDLDGALQLVSGEVEPSGELGPDGPLGTLRTTWRTTRPLQGKPRPRLEVRFADGSQRELSDFAALWWYPPERWRVNELVELSVPGLPLRHVVGWSGAVPPSPAPEPLAALAPFDDRTAAAQPQSDFESFPLGELTVRVRRSSWRLEVLDSRGRQIWRETDLVAGERRGPLGFRLRDGSWWHLVHLTDSSANPDGSITLSASTDDPKGRTATVTLTSLGPRSFRLSLALANAQEVVTIGQAAPTPSDERLLGFGERFTAVNQRGRVVTTWADDRRVAGYGDSTYAPLPFLLSSRGYSLALETDVRSIFDLAVENAERYAWEAETNELSLVFSYGPSPRDLVQQQVARTGLPPLPPVWAFGVWKTAIGGQEAVLRDAARLRDLGIPVSALYVFDAVDERSNLGWPFVNFQGKRRGSYGDLRALTDTVHGRGFKVLGYNTADFHLGRSNYPFPAERGYFLRNVLGQPYVHPGFQISWLDFTNPEAAAWWETLWQRSLVDLGFDGGMLDLGELTPEDARYANGRSGLHLHNAYPRLYARAAFEAAARHKSDSVIFARSGAIGAQAFQHLQWPGDPLVDWSEVGGFKSMLPAALSVGLSGFPFWHPEVGGYLAVGLPRDSERELWFRWLQLGAFSPLLRDHYGDHQTGQEPVEMWSDDETLEAYRFYARVHNSLVPYLYSYAKVASEHGLPLMRHLALNYPDDPRAWIEERQFTLGDELLVAPVVDEGARLRSVYLPAGQWVDFWSGALFEGGRVVTAQAPLERIPVFVKAGSIIPLAPDFDSLIPSADPSVRVWNGDLILKISPSSGPAQSAFRLYDGTRLTYQADGRDARLSVRDAPRPRALEVRLPIGAQPAAVLVNGAPSSDWIFEAASGEVVVWVEAAEVEVQTRAS